jgi:effector-binding domain-containing protein
MLEPTEVIATAAQPIAYIHLTVPASQIRQVMGPGLAELHAALQAQGVTPTGPWFTHHLHQPDAEFDFRICLPVEAPVHPQGRVQAGELPPMRIAETVYHGGYEGLETAWGEFMEDIEELGLKPGPELLECYEVGMESGPDSSAYRTRFMRPLLD